MYLNYILQISHKKDHKLINKKNKNLAKHKTQQ